MPLSRCLYDLLQLLQCVVQEPELGAAGVWRHLRQLDGHGLSHVRHHAHPRLGRSHAPLPQGQVSPFENVTLQNVLLSKQWLVSFFFFFFFFLFYFILFYGMIAVTERVR